MNGGSLPSARTNDHRDLERGRIPADHSVSSQRLVPWSPVIPVKLVPIEPGGDICNANPSASADDYTRRVRSRYGLLSQPLANSPRVAGIKSPSQESVATVRIRTGEAPRT